MVNMTGLVHTGSLKQSGKINNKTRSEVVMTS